MIHHSLGPFRDLERRAEAARSRGQARTYSLRVARMLAMGATLAHVGPLVDEIAELSELARLLAGGAAAD